MKRTSLRFMVLALFLFAIPAGSMAGPFDSLKNLKIDPKGTPAPKSIAPEFQFADFKLNPDTAGASRVWTVELRISQPIAAHRYLVKTVFQNRRGESLFSGEDISLPAGQAGKTYSLTRPFPREPVASIVIFQLYHQAENRVVVSQRYPLSAASSHDVQRDPTSAKPVTPHRSPESSSAKMDANLDVAFVPDPEYAGRFKIQNNSSFPLKIAEVSVKAKFMAGIDQEMEGSACSPMEIQSGQNADCKFHFPADCPTLAAIVVQAKLNGNSYQEELAKFDFPIKEIPKNKPLIQLEKKKKIDDDWEESAGTAKIIIRGTYVKIGGRVTMKALASVDSDRFPVVFDGVQQEDGIHAEITVAGTGSNIPDKFCFHLMEITTCDAPRCGGVGVLLYRNLYRAHPHGDVNIFLPKKVCK